MNGQGAAASAARRLDRERGDAELVADVRAGRREAFGELVRRHQEILFRHARGMGLDRDTCEDLVQDAFVRAYTRLDDCRDPERFGLWAFRILRHACLDHVKDIRRRHVPIDDQPLRSERGRPEVDAERARLRDDLDGALDALPRDHRDAFLMKHHQGLSYAEMAEAADASVSAMKMRVHRAREMLRETLAAAGRDGM